VAFYNLSNLSILIVDDNRNMVTLLCAMLNAFGVQNLKVAYSADAALKTLDNWVPDIILTDWRMKPVGGREFVRMIRTEKNYPHCFTPIIVISGYSEVEKVSEARSVGVNQFLVKPVAPEALYRRIMWTIENPQQYVVEDGHYVPVEFSKNTKGPDDMDLDISALMEQDENDEGSFLI